MPVNFWPAVILLGFLIALRFITGRSAANRARALMMDPASNAPSKASPEEVKQLEQDRVDLLAQIARVKRHAQRHGSAAFP